MVCSAVFIMDLKGKILISRNYRGDIPMSVSEKFTKHLSDTQSKGTQQRSMEQDWPHDEHTDHRTRDGGRERSARRASSNHARCTAGSNAAMH